MKATAKREPYDWHAFKSLVCDSTGRKLTIGLFKELADSGSTIVPPFTIAEWRKVYVAIADPSDYEAAMVLIGNWEHWVALMNCKSFMAELTKWREEVLVKLRSAALANLVKQSQSDKGTAAAKYLIELGGVKATRGRPAKEEPDDSRESNSQIRRDAARLGIVQGGKA